MFSNQEAEVSLEAPIRTLDAVRADQVDSRFIAGSSSLRDDNHLHVIRFHSELNQLGTDAILSHPTGPVQCLCSSPNDKSLVLTVAEASSIATLWRIPPYVMEYSGDQFRHGGGVQEDGMMMGDDDDEDGRGSVLSMEQVSRLEETTTDSDSQKKNKNNIVDMIWRGAFDEEPSAMGDVLTLDQSGRLSQWDLSLGTAECTRSMSTLTDDAEQQWNVPPCMAWDPHNVDMTAVSSGTRVKLMDWRTANGAAGTINTNQPKNVSSATSFPCHRYGITDLDYNPNKPNVLTTAGQDGLLKFWDLRYYNSSKQQQQQPLLVARGGHRHWISQVSYNPFHDQLVISAGSDSLVNLWRMSTISSAPLLTLEDGGHDTTTDENNNSNNKSETSAPNVRVARYEHNDSVYAMAWGAADAWVYVTVGYDGKAVLHHVPSKEKYKILL
jgi:EARP and GARP complex-interacting protein 1